VGEEGPVLRTAVEGAEGGIGEKIGGVAAGVDAVARTLELGLALEPKKSSWAVYTSRFFVW